MAGPPVGREHHFGVERHRVRARELELDPLRGGERRRGIGVIAEPASGRAPGARDAQEVVGHDPVRLARGHEAPAVTGEKHQRRLEDIARALVEPGSPPGREIDPVEERPLAVGPEPVAGEVDGAAMRGRPQHRIAPAGHAERLARLVVNPLDRAPHQVVPRTAGRGIDPPAPLDPARLIEIAQQQCAPVGTEQQLVERLVRGGDRGRGTGERRVEPHEPVGARRGKRGVADRGHEVGAGLVLPGEEPERARGRPGRSPRAERGHARDRAAAVERRFAHHGDPRAAGEVPDLDGVGEQRVGESQRRGIGQARDQEVAVVGRQAPVAEHARISDEPRRAPHLDRHVHELGGGVPREARLVGGGAQHVARGALRRRLAGPYAEQRPRGQEGQGAVAGASAFETAAGRPGLEAGTARAGARRRIGAIGRHRGAQDAVVVPLPLERAGEHGVQVEAGCPARLAAPGLHHPQLGAARPIERARDPIAAVGPGERTDAGALGQPRAHLPAVLQADDREPAPGRLELRARGAQLLDRLGEQPDRDQGRQVGQDHARAIGRNTRRTARHARRGQHARHDRGRRAIAGGSFSAGRRSMARERGDEGDRGEAAMGGATHHAGPPVAETCGYSTRYLRSRSRAATRFFEPWWTTRTSKP